MRIVFLHAPSTLDCERHWQPETSFRHTRPNQPGPAMPWWASAAAFSSDSSAPLAKLATQNSGDYPFASHVTAPSIWVTIGRNS